MRILMWLGVAMTVLSLSSRALAEPVEMLTLEPGDTASLRLSRSSDGAFELARILDTPQLSEFDRAAIGRLERGELDYAMGPVAAYTRRGEDGMPEPLPLQSDIVRFTFVSAGGGGERILIIENGLDRELRYRANITLQGRTIATDVCSVFPNIRGYEHWPDAISRIDVGAFELVEYETGRPALCR